MLENIKAQELRAKENDELPEPDCTLYSTAEETAQGLNLYVNLPIYIHTFPIGKLYHVNCKLPQIGARAMRNVSETPTFQLLQMPSQFIGEVGPKY